MHPQTQANAIQLTEIAQALGWSTTDTVKACLVAAAGIVSATRKPDAPSAREIMLTTVRLMMDELEPKFELSATMIREGFTDAEIIAAQAARRICDAS
jgi:hypothetical protein